MINIRSAGVLDANSIYKCGKKCLPIYYSIIDLVQLMLISGASIIVAEDENSSLCGYIIGQQDGSDLHITSFAVYDSYRRMGIGTKLMNEINKLGKNAGAKKLTLNVHCENKTGILFYKKNGFKKAKTLVNYYCGSIDGATSQNAYKLVRCMDG